MPVMRQSAQQRWTADNPDRPSCSARSEGRGPGPGPGPGWAEGATLSQSVPGSAAARATPRLSSKIAEMQEVTNYSSTSLTQFTRRMQTKLVVFTLLVCFFVGCFAPFPRSDPRCVYRVTLLQIKMSSINKSFYFYKVNF